MKKKFNKTAIVYSTNPDVMNEVAEDEHEQDFLPVERQNIRIVLDKRHRGGKVVTLISGFDASDKAVGEIGKALKKHCGTGGSTEENVILIQGDARQKTSLWLQKHGYKNIKVI